MRLPTAALPALATALMVSAAAALAQGYPNKVIRVVTAAPGSMTDILSRMVARGLVSRLGQQVVVENRGGVGPEIVARASSDGYTLLFYGSAVWVLPCFRRMPYDPIKDLSPISTGMREAIVLVAHPALPVMSVKDLIALAKAKPGQLNYSAGTVGASPHLAMELFKWMAGVDIVRINYKGTGPSVNALLGNEVQMMFAGAGSLMQHIKAGRLRALAVTTTETSPLTPGLPTVAASGLPGYEYEAVAGFFAPARTPMDIVNVLSREIARILANQELNDQLFQSGVAGVGSTPEQFAAIVKSETAKWRKLIKDAGIHEE